MAAITENSEITNDPAVERLAEKAKQFSHEADALRATTDRAAKGLGALATAGLTGVGIAKVGDLYPLPSGEFWPSGGYVRPWLFLWGGFVLMVVAIVAFIYRFWRANRPLAMSSALPWTWDEKKQRYTLAEDVSELQEKGRRRRRQPWRELLSGGPWDTQRDYKPPQLLVLDIDLDECMEIDSIYRDAMKHAPFPEGDESLAEYESRADKLEHDALHTPDSPLSKRRLVQVERMRAEIEKAEQRAKLVVIRRRMNHVFNRWIAVVLAVVFVIGLIMFAVAADYFDSKHAKGAGTASEATRLASIVD